MSPLMFRMVPVRHCAPCGQDMPADHECPGPAAEAFVRAVRADLIRYGSPSDLDHP